MRTQAVGFVLLAVVAAVAPLVLTEYWIKAIAIPTIIFGLSALMWGEINVQGGKVRQTNFHDYRVARINEAPRVDAYVVDSSEAPGGIGEPATALVAPAVCNAIYAATGRRLRSLPLTKHRLA